MGIKYLDMFSGIGGFRSALDRVGGFECVGFCEIDEKAKETYEAIYDTKGELYFNDAREINPMTGSPTLSTGGGQDNLLSFHIHHAA